MGWKVVGGQGGLGGWQCRNDMRQAKRVSKRRRKEKKEIHSHPLCKKSTLLAKLLL